LSSYTVTDLGTLGGPHSFAYAINGVGEVVGRADTTKPDPYFGESPFRPFLWKPSVPNGTKGSMTDLDPGSLGIDPTANGINGPGQVVGDEFVNNNDMQAFLWTPAAPNGTSGGAVTLGTLGGAESHAIGINGSGQVVGWSYTISVPSLMPRAAFLWTPAAPNSTSGTMIDLGTLGGTDSVALHINGSGQVVGWSYTTSGAQAAFLWTPATPNGTSGTMAALPTLSGATAVSADGINDSGQVVGTTGSAAFLYSGGKMIDLGSLAGSSGNIDADAINTRGQVVGSSDMSNGPPHAFIWTPATPNGTSGTMVDLNTLIANRVTLEYASGINDQGQIVGSGLFNNRIHAFLLTPAPNGTLKAQPASSTPPGTIAGTTSVPGSDTSVAPVIASPPSGSGSFGPTGAAVSLWLSQPTAAPADAASQAVPVAPATPFVPPRSGNLPPTDDADSYHLVLASEAARPVFVKLDTETSLAPFLDDLG
jgi:probable HAF family extracellular repeat protein